MTPREVMPAIPSVPSHRAVVAIVLPAPSWFISQGPSRSILLSPTAMTGVEVIELVNIA